MTLFVAFGINIGDALPLCLKGAAAKRGFDGIRIGRNAQRHGKAFRRNVEVSLTLQGKKERLKN